MFKCGIGQDSHAFEPEGSKKKCMLGGITIAGCRGLRGNSDADVALHALTNAISGISGINILGAVSDELCLVQGIIDSAVYLRKALDTLEGWRITHASISLECKRPVLAPHILAMRQSIARLLEVSVDDVGMTATSGEGLTAFGRGQGIAAIAIVSAVEATPLRA